MEQHTRRKQCRLSARDWAVLEDVHRHRVMIPSVVRMRHFSKHTLNAVTKVTSRLVRQRLLCKYPLYHPRIYFTLGPVAAPRLGATLQRTLPLGPQALPTELATLIYTTSGGNERKRLTEQELRELFPDVATPLLDPPHCLSHTQSPTLLEMIRVDLGGKPDHVARKCLGDVNARSSDKQMSTWIAESRLRLVVITSSTGKASAIGKSLAEHTWPTGLTFHLAVVTQLLHLTASCDYGDNPENCDEEVADE